MELQQFVTESLKQIFAGVADVQEFAKEKGGSINPTPSGRMDRIWDQRTGTVIQEVEFDVAVTATEGTETKGGIGVLGGVFALGSQGTTDKSNVALTRIRFVVPIALPSRKVDDP